MVPWFVVGYRVVGECFDGEQEARLIALACAGFRRRVGVAGRFVSWRLDKFVELAMLKRRSHMRPFVGR